VLVLRFEGHTQEAMHRIEGEMLALLRSVKPDAKIGEAAHFPGTAAPASSPRSRGDDAVSPCTALNILIVKLSSLGDVVHTMPAVQDLRAAFPGARIDWVVERGFAPLVQRCEGVRRVIPCELRRWRKAPLARARAPSGAPSASRPAAPRPTTPSSTCRA
jgi:hypothetical protein